MDSAPFDTLTLPFDTFGQDATQGAAFHLEWLAAGETGVNLMPKSNFRLIILPA